MNIHAVRYLATNFKSTPGENLQNLKSLIIYRVSDRMDASLKELTSLVKEVRPDARKNGTIFKFATVWVDRNGRYR